MTVDLFEVQPDPKSQPKSIDVDANVVSGSLILQQMKMIVADSKSYRASGRHNHPWGYRAWSQSLDSYSSSRHPNPSGRREKLFLKVCMLILGDLSA